MAPETAKEFPPGTEIQTFWTTITKARADYWVNQADDTFTDAEIDDVLTRGGTMTRVPTRTAKEQ
ncbi:hypothetical protein ABZ671_01085 [Micromonospora sp. NPDC006766]|uniref:hypothetical protein n=1 Tax=Micromonospora sp. NPDC006766 TaxID=3154778 RepID=UPI0033D76CE3